MFSGICQDKVTNRVDTIAATTPVGADGTLAAKSTPLEPACVRGVVSCGDVGNGASRCNTVLWCHQNAVEEIEGRVINRSRKQEIRKHGARGMNGENGRKKNKKTKTQYKQMIDNNNDSEINIFVNMQPVFYRN